MGESLKTEVKLPVWVFGLLLTILLGLFAFNATFATTKKETEINTSDITVLKATKADKSDVDRIYKKLDSIEQLLIDHMKEKK